jgi:hypothetical protein
MDWSFLMTSVLSLLVTIIAGLVLFLVTDKRIGVISLLVSVCIFAYIVGVFLPKDNRNKTGNGNAQVSTGGIISSEKDNPNDNKSSVKQQDKELPVAKQPKKMRNDGDKSLEGYGNNENQDSDSNKSRNLGREQENNSIKNFNKQNLSPFAQRNQHYPEGRDTIGGLNGRKY